ncbi:UpxY family transcription antiterminator [Pedobacter steynii]|uniref:NusG-like N-terminal domain-containing protein n=1 Tax=Pedobacter steynii TaxID=430522 RepID=A0A1D7QND7_9SPHI|nr:UpxY family transcription antiterminator [Pedobacter steynii]AOM80167.1 hypothetical protein BFS30_25200 [Pedobacter steynii]
MSFLPKWQIVYTRPKNEKLTSRYLNELGIEHLLPMGRMTRQMRDTQKTIRVPLFPSYIFVYLTDIRNVLEVLNLNSVINYVKIGKKIVEVPEKVVNNIKILTNQDDEVIVINDKIKVGIKCAIKEGPFAGLDCEVVNIERKKHILVRLDIFDRNILLEIKNSSLISVLD